MPEAAHAGDGGNAPAERWLCEQLQRARFDLTTRVLPSKHSPGFNQLRGPFDDYDLHFIAKGAIQYVFKERTYSVRAGEFFLIGPGMEFRERDVPNGRGTTLIYAHFTVDSGGRNPLDVLDLPSAVCPRKQARLHELCMAALRRSERCATCPGWHYMAMKADFIKLLCGVIEEGLRAGSLLLNPQRLGPDWLLPVLETINTEIDSPELTLAKLAGRASLSASHFTHQFRRYMGLSPMQFLMQRRLTRASDLLLSRQDLSVKEIAHRCGFSDPYHFSAQFKKHIRQSPSSFRSRQ